MQHPIITNQRLKRFDDIGGIAYTRLYENYLKYDLKGQQKLIEIDSTDQESLLRAFNFGIPIPGMIYTFYHLNEKDLPLLMKGGVATEFHDLAPILFCTYSNPLKRIFGGINLNMLPKPERLKFFSAYYEKYKLFFEDVEELTENNKIAVNLKYVSLIFSGRGQKMIKHFNSTENARFDYGYRKYSVPNVRKFRMVEYEEWRYIPFFEPKQAFKKLSMDEIHKIYYENKNKTK